MRILHTADWHLGKKLDRFSRIEEQKLVMNEIVQISYDQQVDLVLIAGDLFDNFTPSIEAVELFYKTLKQLSANGTRPVIAIAGNHDAPNLISAPNPLAKECGIILIGNPNEIIKPFDLQFFKISNSEKGFIEILMEKYDYPIRILHTPYANEVRLKQDLGENVEDNLNDVLAKNWKYLAQNFCDEKGVNILMAHLYMNSKNGVILEEPDGERPIKIGNADMIFSDAVPPQIQYTALGHLHSFKNIGTEEKPIVYSSSPISYSFSEAGQTKYVSIIDVAPNQKVKVEKIPLKEGKPLFRKTFSEVEKAVEWLQENPNCLVELTIETDNFLTAEERKRIEQSHNGIVYLIPKVKNVEHVYGDKAVDIHQDIDKLFQDYFKVKYAGQTPNEELMNLFEEIVAEHKKSF